MISIERFLHMQEHELTDVSSQRISSFIEYAQRNMDDAEFWPTDLDGGAELAFWSAVASFCYAKSERYDDT